MLYVTLLDQFHPGIYSSQVIDVCDFLNRNYQAKIRLVAFLSIKELLRTDAKKKIKALSPDALVLPAFPGLSNFEWTAVFLFLVCLFTGERIAICRNVFCTKMALRVKRAGLLKKVVLDGRSALSAEIGEYDAFPAEYLRKNVKRIENYSVSNADFRIAVSQQLLDYWFKHYQYRSDDNVVIPCTLDNKYFHSPEFRISNRAEAIRKELGVTGNNILLAYSGSAAPWQSFELMEKLLTPLLDRDDSVKILFLSRENKDNSRFREKYPGRVLIKWLEHSDVPDHLQCCDYGILLREQSDTNRVASPVKFAEYLYAGLPVLISENLGDLSDYVRSNGCGQVIGEHQGDWSLRKTPMDQKKRCFELARRDFMKDSEANARSYRRLMTFLNANDNIIKQQ